MSTDAYRELLKRWQARGITLMPTEREPLLKHGTAASLSPKKCAHHIPITMINSVGTGSALRS